MATRSMRTFTFHLDRRQSAAVAAAAVAALVCAAALLVALFSASHTVIVWCRDVLFAESSRGASFLASIAAAATLAAGAVNAVAFAIREAVAAMRLRRVADGASQIVVIPDETAYAFTAGLIRPRIYISAGLESSLSPIELRAVLAHEDHHRRELHPLRAFLWELARRSFFFLPLIGDVAAHAALGRELAADRAAAADPSERRALASAMLKTVTPRTAATVAAFGHLRSRIEALHRGNSRIELRIVGARFAATVLAIVSLAVGQAAVAAPPHAAHEIAEQCADADRPNMSTINFSPYIRIRLSSMTSADAVQSSIFPAY